MKLASGRMGSPSASCASDWADDPYKLAGAWTSLCRHRRKCNPIVCKDGPRAFRPRRTKTEMSWHQFGRRHAGCIESWRDRCGVQQQRLQFEVPFARSPKTRNCVLVGLDGDRDAIRQHHPELLAVQFQQNSYLNGDFCPEKAETIGARRVLVCSNTMPERDAYLIGMRTFESLRDRMPEIEWRNQPPGAEQIQTGPLRFRLHPGAELIRDQRQPTSWPGGISVVLLTAVLWVIAEMLRWVNSMFDRGTTEEKKSTEAAELPAGEVAEAETEAELEESEYDLLHKEIEESLAELRKTPIPMTKRAYDGWERTIRKLEQKILKSNREGTLTREQAHDLMAGVKRELRLEHEACRPQAAKQQA